MFMTWHGILQLTYIFIFCIDIVPNVCKVHASLLLSAQFLYNFIKKYCIGLKFYPPPTSLSFCLSLSNWMWCLVQLIILLSKPQNFSLVKNILGPEVSGDIWTPCRNPIQLWWRWKLNMQANGVCNPMSGGYTIYGSGN